MYDNFFFNVLVREIQWKILCNLLPKILCCQGMYNVRTYVQTTNLCQENEHLIAYHQMKSYLFWMSGSPLTISCAWPCFSVTSTSYSIPASCKTGPISDLITFKPRPTPAEGFNTISSLRNPEGAGDHTSGVTCTTPSSASEVGK